MEINARPGACVCVARWDGTIVFMKPNAFDRFAQGDTPKWREMQDRAISRWRNYPPAKRHTDKAAGH